VNTAAGSTSPLAIFGSLLGRARGCDQLAGDLRAGAERTGADELAQGLDAGERCDVARSSADASLASPNR
jgi:hypothetical protein